MYKMLSQKLVVGNKLMSQFRFLSAPGKFDQSGNLFPDWFRESTLLVNHRCLKYNTSQWQRKAGMDTAESEGMFFFGCRVSKFSLSALVFHFSKRTHSPFKGQLIVVILYYMKTNFFFTRVKMKNQPVSNDDFPEPVKETIWHVRLTYSCSYGGIILQLLIIEIKSVLETLL